MAAGNDKRESPWSVAYDLMTTVAGLEASLPQRKQERADDPRQYFLDLYREALAAVASEGMPGR